VSGGVQADGKEPRNSTSNWMHGAVELAMSTKSFL
jgi:hypothetical protein